MAGVNYIINVPSGVTHIAGGRVTSRPTWRQLMEPNTWKELNGNTLSDIDPENDAAINPNHPGTSPWHAVSGQPGIILPWCGACFNEADRELWLPLQGGHTDYGGNEPYVFDFNQETPIWAMPRNPTGAIGNTGTLDDGQESTGVYFDGRPRSIHSYNKHVYVPDVGPVLPVQGGCYISGAGGSVRTFSMNQSTAEWTQQTAHPVTGQISAGGAACYDSSRHRVWWIPSGTADMSYLDIATWSWTVQIRTDSNQSGEHTLVYIPTIDVLVQINTNIPSGGLGVWLCSDTSDRFTPTLSGSSPGLTVLNQCGASWSEALGQILIWNNSIGTTETIYTLTPPTVNPAGTWVWGQLPVDAANVVTPTAKTPNGTYGRFGYSESLGGCYLLNAVDEPVYFYATD